MTTHPDKAREAAAKALMGIHRGWKGNDPADFIFPDPIEARSYADLVLDAFLAASLPADVGEIAQRAKRDAGWFDPGATDGKRKVMADAHRDRVKLLDTIALLAAQKKEVEAERNALAAKLKEQKSGSI